MNPTVSDAEYWNNRYLQKQTGWDIGYAAPALCEILNKQADKNIKILIPGCGNAHEAIYAKNQGFNNVTLLDFSEDVCRNFLIANTAFKKQEVVCADFFEHEGKYDLILEQTFFCAIDPSRRAAYAAKMHYLLNSNGMLSGLLFDTKFESGPPFGGSALEYQKYFQDLFHIEKMEPCQNSIPARAGRELIVALRKKDL